jgi:hypothetical protein
LTGLAGCCEAVRNTCTGGHLAVISDAVILSVGWARLHHQVEFGRRQVGTKQNLATLLGLV